jgi:hypothetical protein
MQDKEINVIEYGDYQTPLPFARSVCSKLRDMYNLSPSIIIEPTFGIGNFIEGARSEFVNAKKIYGIELNNSYYSGAVKRFESNNDSRSVKLFNEDIFAFDFSHITEGITPNDSIVIIGNPPWVTNSQLSSLQSYNIPMKENFKGCSGLDAITGKGNFDIAEYIILQLLSRFANYNCTLAMLCKTIVAKNIIRDLPKYKFSISEADMFVFDAKEVFDASCDATLLVVKLGGKNSEICNVYDYKTNTLTRKFGWQEGAFYSDISSDDALTIFDGKCPLEWRQGVKHDCSKVMELKSDEESCFINGLGETIVFSIGEYVFPLVKSSDVKSDEINTTRKYVIVPQRQVNADTSIIKSRDETLWGYLLQHESLLNSRKSIIYKKSPKYSVFGVGDYSFAKYKVGISGFYKEPAFALLVGEYPIMMDDTCYFLSFEQLSDAVITTALLNSPECRGFLKSIAFMDSKRPYTKEVLKRIDLFQLHKLLPYEYVRDYAKRMKGNYAISVREYEDYLREDSHVAPMQLQFA